jgi:toxin-antitoxin system PIN domain toxin
VKLPDLNLLLYAVDTGSRDHERAKRWLEQTLSGTEAVGFAWLALLGFIRISTNPTALEHPLSPSESIDYVDEWLATSVATILQPTHQHATVLRRLLESVGTAGNLTTDAHLAALAIEHGAELCSHDADFSRFEGLRWTDPLR